MVHSINTRKRDRSIAAIAASVKVTTSKVAKQSHLHEESANKVFGKLFG